MPDTTTQNRFEIGDKVSYEDMANPRRVGYICDIDTTRWGTRYDIAWTDGTITTSDCRQAGWTRIAGR